MATLDDLLSKRRRGALSAAEARRLGVAVQSSSEYELSLLAGDAFDRDGAPAPGDAELVRRIALQVEQRWYQRFARRGLRKPLPLLVVVPVFLAGAAAASYGGYRAVQALTAPEAVAVPVSTAFAHGPSAQPASAHPVAVSEASQHAAATVVEPIAVGAAEDPSVPPRSVPPRATAPRSRGDGELAGPSAREASVPERPTAVAGSAVVPRRRYPAHGAAASSGILALAAPASENREPGALPARTSPTPLPAGREAVSLPTAREATPSGSEPELARDSEATSGEATSAVATSGVATSVVATSVATSAVLDDASAAALFKRAQALRKRDWPAAASLYEQLIRRHPASPEAGISEMALGKWSLSRGRAQDALTWFRAHQRRPSSALAAEAIWGEAQALERLGVRALASGPWRRLIEQYPTSPYARVARQQLRHAE